MNAPPAPIPASRTTPLWAVLLLTFLCSIGSGVIYGGIFFLAKAQYHFTPRDNYILALLYGITYIPGAVFAGTIQRFLHRWNVSPRTLLGAMMVIMGAICFIPLLIDHFTVAASSRPTWPIWAVIAIYAPLSGLMWPVMEAFLAGGRTEAQLRAATGQFNVTWSSAIVVTMLAIAGLLEHHPLLIMAALGVVHLGCIAIVTRFEPFPARHEHHEHDRPLIYRRLLTFLRLMLPVSFMFNSTLSPYMPEALTALKVPLAWQTPVAAVWYSTRVLTFLTMGRWHGWHGRWTAPIFGSLLLLGSFAWLILVPILAPPNLGLPLFILGLATFGIAVGIVYAAALYYAMEVGSSGVDAGGTHEALIGLGYTVGPVCLLTGLGTAAAGLIKDESANLLTLAIVAAIALAVGSFALYRAFHLTRQAA